MKVSVIVPTRLRPRHLEAAYRGFDAQTHADKELLIDDDSPEPCDFFVKLRDPRVRYVHARAGSTIGAKRDRLVRAAQGEVVAHFDDDDHYAPSYLTRMSTLLVDGKLDLVKLSAWFLHDARSGGLFYWDTTTVMAMHIRVEANAAPRPVSMSGMGVHQADWLDRHLWGYGFSYVFRRTSYGVAAFDLALDHGEDMAFIRAARAAGWKMQTVPDEEGLALHVIHKGNTSCVFPNYHLPAFELRARFGRVEQLEVA